MQRIDDGIAPCLACGIAGRKKDQHLAVHRIALQVAFEGFAVDVNVFNGGCFGSWDNSGYIGCNLATGCSTDDCRDDCPQEQDGALQRTRMSSIHRLCPQ